MQIAVILQGFNPSIHPIAAKVANQSHPNQKRKITHRKAF
jgi:hypothetical protein